MNNHLSDIKLYTILSLIFFYPLITITITPARNNQLLKKRVVERRAHDKIDDLLKKTEKNSMQELLDSLQGMNKLLEVLHATSIDEAITIATSMQQDIKKLLNSLQVETVDAAVTQAKQVKKVMHQLAQIQK